MVINKHIFRDQDIDNATCCIALVHCADGVVENCSLRGSQRGLGLYDTKATVIGSILKDNMVGIDVQKKSYQGSLQLSRNVLSGNRVGARIDGIDYSKIEGNLFSENVLTGLEMVKGVYTAVFHNLFKDNQGPAVSIKPTCTDSVICWNAFIGNNGSMERHTAQANDDGHNNSWASGKGNFWYGNAGKDGDGDLVLDDPLEIPGSAGSVDPLPMVRIPAGVLPPPCDIEIGTSEGSVVMNWGHKAGLMNATGFRLYIGGTPFREFDNGTRSFSLSFIELPQGELTMTTQCSFGEGEETQAMVLREDTEGPRISRNTDRKEFSSVRDSFTVEIFDPSDLPYVRCRFDDLEWIHIDEITEGSLFSMPLTTLAEGPHTVTIEARDRYWNPSNASFDILIDDSPPELSINLPGNSDLLNTTALPLTYSIREVVGTLERHMVRLDGTEMDLPPNGSVSLEGLKDGDHVLMLSAIDVAGNLNILTSDFTIDTRAPKVLAWSPEGSSLAEGVVIKVTLDEVPSNSSLWLDGGQLGSSVDGMVILGIPVDLDPGSFHNASVEGRDMAGNTFEFSWTFLTAFEEVPKVLVTGRLIDTYGRTLFGVEVWVSSALETTTGDNGTFEFLLEPGKHLMELKLDGHLTRTLVINVTAQGSNDLGDIVMERLGDIGEDPKGRPIWPYLLGALALAVIITILLLRRSSREGRQEE